MAQDIYLAAILGSLKVPLGTG